MTIHTRSPALSAAAKMNRMNKVVVALRKAARAQSQKTVENAETALKRDQGENEQNHDV